MSEPFKSVEVHLGLQIRLVIRAALGRLLGLKVGNTSVAGKQLGRLVLEKQSMLQQRLKAWFAQVPNVRSLVDKLIAERREDGKREVAE